MIKLLNTLKNGLNKGQTKISVKNTKANVKALDFLLVNRFIFSFEKAGNVVFVTLSKNDRLISPIFEMFVSAPTMSKTRKYEKHKCLSLAYNGNVSFVLR